MKNALLAAALTASILGLSVSAQAQEAKVEREKCYGVAKAGKNDCAAKDGSNSCAGQQVKDQDPMNWIYLPKGVCAKLAGGQTG